MFIGAAGQGQFSDRWGRKTVYQFNLLLFGIFTILGAFAPTVWWLVGGALHRRHRPRRRAAARVRLRRRIFAQGDPRPHPGDRALHRRRLRVADRLAVHAVLPRFDRLARRVDRDRHRRADRLAVPLHAAGIAALSRHPRQGQGSAGCARTPGHRRADRAAHHRRRERHQERSVRRRVQDVPEARDRRHDLLLGVLRRRDRTWARGCPTS